MNTNTLTENAQLSGYNELQPNANEMENKENYSIQNREEIENTPFHLVTTTEGCFIAMGNNRISDITSKEECEKQVQEKNWKLVLIAAAVYINSLNKLQ